MAMRQDEPAQYVNKAVYETATIGGEGCATLVSSRLQTLCNEARDLTDTMATTRRRLTELLDVLIGPLQEPDSDRYAINDKDSAEAALAPSSTVGVLAYVLGGVHNEFADLNAEISRLHDYGL